MTHVQFSVQNMLNDYREIGSEYWIESVPETLLHERDGVFVLSGRTAIDIILQEILQKRTIKNVAMPAWCCESMVAPFYAHNIEVVFYEENKLPDTDILYVTNYFGYENTISLETVISIKKQGCIVIYDRTHSFLMDDWSYVEQADYSFASIRKWMGVVSGAEIKGLSKMPLLKEYPYVVEKEKAMRDKFLYLEGETAIKKEEFLTAFGEFGHHLTEYYKNYRMDDLSYTLYKQADIDSIKKQRKKNAAYIQENLKGVQTMFSLTDNAVPLFVPVLLESKEQRDLVRKSLIEQQIYCPVHWPQPSQISELFKANDIVSRELSLICDQRYGEKEMKRIIEIIHQNI